MTPGQKELLNYMKQLSRRYFHNEWEDGLEFILWRWSRHESLLHPIERFALYSQYNAIKGWIIVENAEHAYIERDKWLELLAEEFEES